MKLWKIKLDLKLNRNACIPSVKDGSLKGMVLANCIVRRSAREIMRNCKVSSDSYYYNYFIQLNNLITSKDSLQTLFYLC
jgi:hypothetical protein